MTSITRAAPCPRAGAAVAAPTAAMANRPLMTVRPPGSCFQGPAQFRECLDPGTIPWLRMSVEVFNIAPPEAVMTHRFRNVIAVVAAAAWLSAPVGAQQPQQGQ